MTKYLSVTYLLISKKTSALAWAVKNIDFWGVSGGVVQKKFRGKKLRLQLNNFTQELDGSLPANPVNDRRVANAVTLKSTFCLP